MNDKRIACFFALVDPRHDGCWHWVGSTRRNYGKFRLNGKTVAAHRIAYELLVGAIPDGLTIDHLCQNKLCVNPDHLEPVTHRENALRSMVARGVPFTDFANIDPPAGRMEMCRQGHPLSGDNIMLETKRGRTQRRCRICRAASNRISDAKRRARLHSSASPSLTGCDDGADSGDCHSPQASPLSPVTCSLVDDTPHGVVPAVGSGRAARRPGPTTSHGGAL